MQELYAIALRIDIDAMHGRPETQTVVLIMRRHDSNCPQSCDLHMSKMVRCHKFGLASHHIGAYPVGDRLVPLAGADDGFAALQCISARRHAHMN